MAPPTPPPPPRAAAGAEVVGLPDPSGLGAAVRRGLAVAVEAGAVVVAFCDADGEYAPEEMERLATPILTGRADYVVGSRFSGGPRRMRPHRWFGNRVRSPWLCRPSSAAASPMASPGTGRCRRLRPRPP